MINSNEISDSKIKETCLRERILKNEACIKKEAPLRDEDVDEKSLKYMRFLKCDEKVADEYNACIKRLNK